MSQSTTAADSVELPQWSGEAPINYEDLRESVALALDSAGVDEATATEVIATVDEAVVANDTHLEWPDSAEQANNHLGKPVTEVQAQNVPAEVVEYAFDQLEATTLGALLREYHDQPLVGDLQFDYGDQTVSLAGRTALEQVLQTKMDEKLAGMLWEVRHGERDDYTRSELKAARRGMGFTVRRQYR